MNTKDNQTDAVQLDTARIFSTLMEVESAPPLSRVLATQFQNPGESTQVVDQEALSFLLEEQFVAIPASLAKAVQSYRQKMARAEPIHEEKKESHRRLKSLAVRQKHAEKNRNNTGGCT